MADNLLYDGDNLDILGSTGLDPSAWRDVRTSKPAPKAKGKREKDAELS